MLALPEAERCEGEPGAGPSKIRASVAKVSRRSRVLYAARVRRINNMVTLRLAFMVAFTVMLGAAAIVGVQIG